MTHKPRNSHSSSLSSDPDRRRTEGCSRDSRTRSFGEFSDLKQSKKPDYLIRDGHISYFSDSSASKYIYVTLRQELLFLYKNRADYQNGDPSTMILKIFLNECRIYKNQENEDVQFGWTDPDGVSHRFKCVSEQYAQEWVKSINHNADLYNHGAPKKRLSIDIPTSSGSESNNKRPTVPIQAEAFYDVPKLQSKQPTSLRLFEDNTQHTTKSVNTSSQLETFNGSETDLDETVQTCAQNGMFVEAVLKAGYLDITFFDEERGGKQKSYKKHYVQLLEHRFFVYEKESHCLGHHKPRFEEIIQRFKMEKKKTDSRLEFRLIHENGSRYELTAMKAHDANMWVEAFMEAISLSAVNEQPSVNGEVIERTDDLGQKTQRDEEVELDSNQLAQMNIVSASPFKLGTSDGSKKKVKELPHMRSDGVKNLLSYPAGIPERNPIVHEAMTVHPSEHDRPIHVERNEPPHPQNTAEGVRSSKEKNPDFFKEASIEDGVIVKFPDQSRFSGLGEKFYAALRGTTLCFYEDKQESDSNIVPMRYVTVRDCVCEPTSYQKIRLRWEDGSTLEFRTNDYKDLGDWKVQFLLLLTEEKSKEVTPDTVVPEIRDDELNDEPVPKQRCDAPSNHDDAASDSLKNGPNHQAQSDKKKLLEWCRTKVRLHKDIAIDDFADCWTSGIALNALMHALLPNSVPLSKHIHTLPSEDLKHAIATAERHFELTASCSFTDFKAGRGFHIHKFLTGLFEFHQNKPLMVEEETETAEMKHEIRVLRWCQDRVADYRNVDVQNFTNSWKSGLVLSAIIHSMRPEFLDYDNSLNEERYNRITDALDLAQQVFGIAVGVPVEDIISAREDVIFKIAEDFYTYYQDMFGQKEDLGKTEIVDADFEPLVKEPECPEGMERCKNCSVLQKSQSDGVQVFKCFDCRAMFCRICKVDWFDHQEDRVLNCEEAKEAERQRLQREHELTMVLFRQCHRCKRFFAKDGGCNNMQCICGATQCYCCEQKDVEYNHFCSHQDAEDPDFCTEDCGRPCPLNSDEDRVNAVARTKIRGY